MIEQPEALELERLQARVLGRLKRWQESGVRLILVSMRQFSDRLKTQLRRLELENLFDEVVVSMHERSGESKAQMVRRFGDDIPMQRCLWVGNTEVDIEGARALGCRVAAVTCGLRNEAFLFAHSPDLLASSLTRIDLGHFDGP